MKKILSLLITTVLFCQPAWAQSFTDENGLSYTILDEDARTCALCQNTTNPYAGDLVIPETTTDPTTETEYTVTAVKAEAFKGSKTLTSVTFGNSITTLGSKLFYTCTPNVQSIHLGSGITTIDPQAFADAGLCGLTTLTVSEDNPNFSAAYNILYNKDKTQLIYCASKNADIQYPDGIQIQSLAANAFSFFRGESLRLPEGLTTISYDAFNNTTLIEHLTIPSTLTSFPTDINNNYQGCGHLENIYVAQGSTTFSSIDGVLYNYDETELVCFPLNKSSLQIEYPSSLIKLGDFSFNYYQAKDVRIPETVQSIGKYCFSHAVITSVSVPDATTSLGAGTFSNCANLAEVTLGDGIQTLPINMFMYDSKLQRLTLGNSLTEISSTAFSSCGCLLQYIECHATELPLFGIEKKNITTTAILAVPGTAIGKYLNSPSWSQIPYIKAYDCDLTVIDGIDYVGTSEARTPDDINIFAKDYNKLCYYREFNNTKWQPLFVPFNLSQTDLQRIGLQAAVFTQIMNYGDDVYSLKYTTEIPNGLVGNQVALIRADKAEAKVLIAEHQNTTEDNNWEQPTLTDNPQIPSIELTFCGTYSGESGEDIYDNSWYVISGGILARLDLSACTPDIILKPQRWYMKMVLKSAPTSAPSFRIESEDDLVVDYGTDMLTVDNGDGTIEIFFSLDGKRLEAQDIQDLKPGIYVQNGKKMMVK